MALATHFRVWDRIKDVDMFFQKSDPVHKTLRRTIKNLEKAKIPYALLGGMAVNLHGYRRTTNDVDILLTAEGLAEFQRRFVPKHYDPIPRRPRRFADRKNQVVVDFLVTGLFPGAGKPGPIGHPDPAAVRERIENIEVVNLPTLVERKLAAGRYQDFADVVSLIRIHQLDESFADRLHSSVRSAYLECLEAKRRKTSAPTAANTSELALPLHARLLKIAATYPEYGRVDDTMRWAHYWCEEPPPPALRASASKDTQTHGSKLYSILAKIHTNEFYIGQVGQIVVKESWLPEEVADNGQDLQAVSRMVKVPAKEAKESTKTVEIYDRYVPYVRKDGRLYHAAKQGPLFIMFKMDPKTPDTDEGWVYGSVTADGKEVTSAGRVESCMNCHRNAPHDRLFGLPKQ